MRPGTRFGRIGNALGATQAQLAEHQALNPQVPGSSPRGRTTKYQLPVCVVPERLAPERFAL